MNVYLIMLFILALICLSAFFSGSEMAFSSCNLLRLQNLRDEGSKRAYLATIIAEDFDKSLSAILIGNNLVNIGASSLMSVLIILLTGSDKYTWIGTVILTITVIIFGETIPKICAKKSANRFSLLFAYPVHTLTILLTPLIWLVVKLNWLLTFWIKEDAEDHGEEAVEELHSIIETAEDEAVLDVEQSELLRSAIDFSDVSALDVMTARVDVIAIDIEDSWEMILSQIEKASFSRLPVYEGSIDNIIGVLYLNRFLKSVADGGKTDIRSLLMPPCYIYKTMKLPTVLNQLRRAKQHLAVVTDEYGGTLGVLSMEDVLEQIVGDIWDENDDVDPDVVQRPDGEYELDGSMMLFEMEELLGLSENTIEAESSTVGGWMIECFDGFPHIGDSFEKHGFSFTVLEMSDARRVDKVLIKRIAADSEPN